MSIAAAPTRAVTRQTVDSRGTNGDGVVFTVANSLLHREAAFRLVYESYLRAGLIEPNPCEMRVMPYHLAATTGVFVALERETVICTISLVGDGPLGLPMEAIYAEELSRLRARLAYMGEISCLAERQDDPRKLLPVLIQLGKLVIQSAFRRGLDYLLLAVHPRHARFYRRFWSFEPIGELRSHPLVRNRPAVALAFDLAAARKSNSEMLQSMIDDSITDEQLEIEPMTGEEQDYFSFAAEFGKRFTPLADDAEATVVAEHRATHHRLRQAALESVCA
jgi:hypothetical protein